MTKILYSANGYFELSEEARKLYMEETGTEYDEYADNCRSDPVLIGIVEELGLRDSSIEGTYLAIEVLSPGTKYTIVDNNDAGESVLTINDFIWNIA